MADGEGLPERRRYDPRVAEVLRRLDDFDKMASSWDTSQLGPMDRASLPRGILWFREQEKEIANSGKTGLQILNEVIWNHVRGSRIRIALYGGTTTVALVLFTALVNFIVTRLTPTIPAVHP